MGGVETKWDADIGHVDDLEQQIKHSVIMDLLCKFLFENVVRNAVEEVMNIHF